MTVIDIHSHFLPRTWTDFAEKFQSDHWPWMKHLGDDKAMLMLGDKAFRPVTSACWNVEKRLEAMDKCKLDKQVICATPVLFAYDRKAEEALYCSQIFNDIALDMCSRSSGRLLALAQVPLQNIDMACEEATRAVNGGHKGVQIGNHVGDKDLDNEGLITFLQHCAAIGASVLVHPWDLMGSEKRMKKYMLPWLVSMPAETQLSILSLILSGAFERLPKSLRLCFAHGGGSFPYLLGRVDNAWKHRDIIREDCPNLPSSYVNRFSVDSAVFSQKSLKLLTDVMGDDYVLLGTDYPFPLGEQDMGNLIRTSPNHTEKQKTKMLSNNAMRWLGLAE